MKNLAAAAPLPPFPDGWYAMGLSRELEPGKLETVPLAGHDVILYRTQSGEARAVDAFCPHLGAHFGKGGTVEGENLRCPFHFFEFDGEGACVKTGYDTKPPAKCTLATWPLLERNGLLLVWWSANGDAPSFEPPETDGWDDFAPMRSTVWRLDSHPQETTENSVDLGHLSVVHGYHDVEQVAPLRLEGPYLNSRYAMSRPAGIFGRAGMIRSEFEVHVHGLGYSYVEVEVPAMDFAARLFVLPRPIAEGKLELRVCSAARKVRKPAKLNPILAIFPKPLVTWMAAIGMHRGYTHDVSQDFDVWQHKIYLDRPVLAAGDGPIGRYRKWCRQFYPEYADRATQRRESPSQVGEEPAPEAASPVRAAAPRP